MPLSLALQKSAVLRMRDIHGMHGPSPSTSKTMIICSHFFRVRTLLSDSLASGILVPANLHYAYMSFDESLTKSCPLSSGFLNNYVPCEGINDETENFIIKSMLR